MASYFTNPAVTPQSHGDETVKKLGLLVALLFLASIVTGCGYYTVQNGTQINCTPGADCGNSYYLDNGYGNTYHCDSSGCDTSNPITPPAASPAACSCSAPPASIQQNTPTQCVPNWIYDQLTDKGIVEEVITKQENVNSIASPAQETFVATTSKTVTVSDELNFVSSASFHAGADIDIGVDIGASITASVKLNINHAVVKSVTTIVGDSVTVTIPAKKTGYAIYGVRMQTTSGHLYDKGGCEGNKSDAGTDTTYTPITAGWCTWDSDTSDPCPTTL